jgi:hypothetical protein
MLRSAVLMVAGALLACATEAPIEEPGTVAVSAPPAPPASLALIDTAFPPAVAGEEGWDFQQSVSGDLDGDGQAERVVLTARVELVRGQPAWDDGQPWQVYVESSTGSRTYLYAQRLQLGTLTMRMTEPDSAHLPTVILLEQLPDRLRIIEVSFPAADSPPRLVLQFERRLDAPGEIGEH